MSFRLLNIFIFSFFILAVCQAQVPDIVYFADLKLVLSKGAKEIIEKDVKSITKNQKYFATIVQRADLYFPVIEKVFREEGAPEDFKFLALQESSLTSDAVSSSNAVGYWQFKKETAQEVGLQVDHEIDERKNIVASSRGAAKYLKKGNVVLNNWLYTLLAYYLGRGGVRPYVKEEYRQATEMDIDESMNWYVFRFLAHKIAYENQVGKVPHPDLKLSIYTNGNKQTLKDIANDQQVDLETLLSYNKWLHVDEIPEGRTYYVVLPYKVSQPVQDMGNIFKDQNPTDTKPTASAQKPKKEERKGGWLFGGRKSSKQPNQANEPQFKALDLPLVVTYNKLKAVQARKGDSFAKLAYCGDITVKSFLHHNELNTYDELKPGQFYYLQPKRSTALTMYHTVQPNENLWDIAQKYGIRSNDIRKKNRMHMSETPMLGRVLWLTHKRPKKQPIEYKEIKKVETPAQVLQDKKQLPMAKTDSVLAKEAPISESEPKKVEKNIDVTNSVERKDSLLIHEVQLGQTLYAISKIYHQSIDSIMVWNNLISDEISLHQRLVVGKISFIPNSESTPLGNMYVVRKGDTLYKIAREHHVSVDDILKWNNKNDFIVNEGDNIIINK